MIDKAFVDKLLKVVHRAGEAILEVYSTNFEVIEKEDGSPVTKADYASNQILVDFLARTNLPIMSEESDRIPFETRKKFDQYWCVDPLDGTREFLNRSGQFVICVALIENGKPSFGLIYHPESETAWYNLNGRVLKYAYVNNAEQPIKPVKTRSNSARVFIVSNSFRYNNTARYLDEQKAHVEVEVKTMGSALKFCFLVEGKADEYPRFAPTMEWDTAAGHAIVKTAGFQVLNGITGKELTYNKENLRNPSFIVK